ncbi:hypothetical protein CALCODRAFT_104756 [Calocera cornea HHB12733]|uniref:Uncharacterized protein n=1 Tax=Calocera cornea HHB12733 TaxID=1353952 RepID=A0A165D471_9BASI|nr:hypothetical protein CALCODRAFT_104756 [Calocera cornea HHB12733]
MRLFPKRRRTLLLSLPPTALLLLLLYTLFPRAPPSAHLRRPPPTPAELQQLRANTTQKYALFNQLRGAGFNNQLQESLLLAHLAARAGRAYVYRDVVWRPRGYDTVPAEAFFGEPLTAAPAIHEVVFEQLCEGQQVREVDVWGEHERRVDLLLQALEGPEQCASVKWRVMDWRCVSSRFPFPLPLPAPSPSLCPLPPLPSARPSPHLLRPSSPPSPHPLPVYKTLTPYPGSSSPPPP